VSDEAAAAAGIAARLLGRDPGPFEPLSQPGRRNLVLRLPGALIVKRILGQDAGERFAREAASLGLPGLPRLVARCDEAKLLVMEDVGPAGSMVAPLSGDDPDAAEAALLAWARALGAVHGTTLGHRPLPCPLHIDIDALPPAIDAALPRPAVAALLARGPGPFRSWLHHDPCPDNVLLSGGAARLIDFERSGSGFCLMDVAYLRMGLPTCWCAGAIPSAVVARVEDTYRQALAPCLPAAADDAAFKEGIEAACALWFLRRLGWLLRPAMTADSTWGIAPRRARLLHDAETVAAGSTALAQPAEAIASILRGWWPASSPLAPYAAFSAARILASPSR
jgi:hypothetical protein